mmetsp:Transcript_25163/g.58576  ORF Transcript_25163/g.58576 Transcript_25163/m.58576 type:complete len:285 (+) Transcript_25163:65-919(+)
MACNSLLLLALLHGAASTRIGAQGWAARAWEHLANVHPAEELQQLPEPSAACLRDTGRTGNTSAGSGATCESQHCLCLAHWCAGADGQCWPDKNVRVATEVALGQAAAVGLSKITLLRFPVGGAYTLATPDGRVLACLGGSSECSLHIAPPAAVDAPSCAFRLPSDSAHLRSEKLMESVRFPGSYITAAQVAQALVEQHSPPLPAHHKRCQIGLYFLGSTNCVWLKVAMAVVWFLLCACVAFAFTVQCVGKDNSLLCVLREEVQQSEEVGAVIPLDAPPSSRVC